VVTRSVVRNAYADTAGCMARTQKQFLEGAQRAHTFAKPETNLSIRESY